MDNRNAAQLSCFTFDTEKFLLSLKCWTFESKGHKGAANLTNNNQSFIPA